MTDKIRAVFDLLGVEPGEEFRVINNSGVESTCKLIIDKNLVCYDKSKNAVNNNNLVSLLNGSLKPIKIPKLTEEDKIIIRYAKLCGAKWIAADKDGEQFMSDVKPQRDEEEEVWTYEFEYDFVLTPLRHKISFVAWEDDEPFFIGNLEV